VWAAAPPPTLQMMMTPSAQRTALYQGYVEVSRMLDSGQSDAALSKLKGLEKSDPSNALTSYLRAYAHFGASEYEKALASIRAGNARPYLVTYLDSKGGLSSSALPHMQIMRALGRGLVSYAAGLPARERIQALRALSTMASKTLTGRPFIIITSLVGMALHRMVDEQLGSAYYEAGDSKAAAAVQDRQNRLERLKTMLQAAGEQQEQSADAAALKEALAQGKPLPRDALVRHELQEERLVRDALKATGFLPG